MTNEIKFADTVILVDVAYVDRVAGDLSKHFGDVVGLSLIHISEPTRQAEISYAVFCLKKKKTTTTA